ncbi:gluconate:H+ symporter [Sphingobium aquiterrae]|uniref:GntP family permease n=1 Tax=Sphingobium aquiterrae TaxID=2038656 RepID=UPI0030173532
MHGDDLQLIVAAVSGIGLSVLLIVKGRLHPFIALLCGAFATGLIAGLSTEDTAKAVQKGVGDILGGTGLVVALGLSLGAMLQLSGGASSLARAALGITGQKAAPWASLFIAMIIGLPLFFETGLVLLLPIVAAAAATVGGEGEQDERKLQLMLPALTGLSVVHALVPPHPGPLLAINALGADMGRTMLWGLAIAVPTAIIAGPLLARYTARGIRLSAPVLEQIETSAPPPPKRCSLIVVLMPVVLIAAGQLHTVLPPDIAPRFAWVATASNPVLALLFTNLVALPLLFGRRIAKADTQTAIWSETMHPAGAILLSIAAGGALKQVLVAAGLSDLLVKLASTGAISPIVLAWLVAVGIRLATGSATVATITTAGIMPGIVAATGVDPVWIVLAIGAGSVFFSHVNDPGFWLVKSYLSVSTADTFRTWSALETAISVIGLLLVLCASALF